MTDETGARRPALLAPEVVGREPELAALRDAVRSAAEGHGRMVLLVGEAGIGKSRLAQVAATEAEQRGLRLLRGRAVAASTPVPYRPFAEALGAAVRVGAVPETPALAPFRAVLGRLVPDWRDDERAEVEDSVLVLAEGVLRVLVAVAGDHGCVLVLEDLHWADPETLTIVEYVADHLADSPVLCVATVRDEPSAGLRLARDLHARRTAALLDLRRLDDSAVALMVESCLATEHAPPELINLARRADGVPFLVEELLAAAVASGAVVRDRATWQLSGATDVVVPLTFGDSVRRRLDALGPTGRRVLGAAAVLGRRFDWGMLPAVAEEDEATVIAALQAAVDAQLVAVDAAEGSFRFRHALSRDAVLTELLPPERSTLCRRALERIDDAHPGLPGPWLELAAEVAEGSGERARAAALRLEGGRRARDAGALATAEAMLERARALAPPDDVTAVEIEECLLGVMALTGKHERAVEVGESLLSRLGREPGTAARRATTQLRLARAAVTATQWDEADARLGRAIEEAAHVVDDALRAQIDVVAAQVAILRHPEQASAIARDALRVAERVALPEVVCEALEIIGRFERARDLDAAEAAFSRARDVATTHDRPVWASRALHELGTVELLRAGATSRLEEARAWSLALGAPALTAVIDVQIGAVATMRDDPEPGADACRRAAAVARRYRLDETLAAALAFEAVSHARAGRRADVERCLAEAASARDTPESRFNAAFARAHLAFVDDDRRAAMRTLAAHTVPAADAVGVQTTGPNAAMLGLLLAVEGDDAAASSWLAEPGVHFLARGDAAYARAVMAGRAGARATAVELVAHGDAALADFAWYRHHGHRLVAESAVADGWGDPARWLLDALAFFEGTADARIASACRSLLRRAGVPVPRRRGAPAAHGAWGALGVTAREAEVLELVGRGLSNQEIGARLFMSSRTVERHVANLTSKVGVARRTELVAFAAASGGPPDPTPAAPGP